MKTAIQLFISDILSGKITDTIANQEYYLEIERQQIEAAHIAGLGYTPIGSEYKMIAKDYYDSRYKVNVKDA